MLQNKISLVTGASSGIGRATALVFAREGAKVVVSDVQAEKGEETAALVRAQGGDAIFIEANVADAQACVDLVGAAVKHYGRLAWPATMPASAALWLRRQTILWMAG